MNKIRKQLTLFISDQKEIIEKIRSEFNPVQHKLIAAHVTLCREDEIENLDHVIQNIQSIQLTKPLHIEFDPVQRFENGKGVLIPAKESNIEFDELRRKVLKGINESPRKHQPHITLMHPRNSTCTDADFERISKYKLPEVLSFDQISLIEQEEGNQWINLKNFSMVSR